MFVRGEAAAIHSPADSLQPGLSFIYISHRHAEVHELGDRVTILRDGGNEGTYRVADFGANPGAQPPRYLSGACNWDPAAATAVMGR